MKRKTYTMLSSQENQLRFRLFFENGDFYNKSLNIIEVMFFHNI